MFIAIPWLVVLALLVALVYWFVPRSREPLNAFVIGLAIIWLITLLGAHLSK